MSSESEMLCDNSSLEKDCDSNEDKHANENSQSTSDKESNEIHYSIVEGGTKRGRPKLFDSYGYSYCMRDQRDQRTHWTCSVRGKKNACPARVIQIGENYERRHKHNHTVGKFECALFGTRQKKTPKSTKSQVKRGPRKSNITPTTENTISCTVVEGGTKRGRPKLFDSDGYSYAMRGKRNNMTFWTCTIRRKGFRCPASVTQYGDGDGSTFIKGINSHSHASNRDSRKVVEMSVKIKKKAVAEPFKSALQIVREVYSQDDCQESRDVLPKVSSMAHKASHFRRSCLPKEPQTLDFELALTSLPSDFLLKDIRVDHHRHIVFATSDQLEVLSRASTWYVDTTNMLVKKPFIRLLTFSTYIQSELNGIQHSPLIYCFMSKQRQQDFKAVLDVVKNRLTGVAVTSVVASFEKGQWKAFDEVFSCVELRGCAYNFDLGIQQKIKSMGLEDEYSKNAEFHNYVRKLKSLPFLHSDHIVPEFMYLRSQGEDPSIRGLINYIDDNWILCAEWPVPKWSVFKSLVRHKEDCESWRRRIRHKARCGHCHFYHLVGLLYRESQNISPELSLPVLEEDLRKKRGQSPKLLQASLEAIWSQYESSSLTVDDITNNISNILP